MDNAGTLFLVPGEKPMPPVTVHVVARGPVKSKGPEAINRQLDTFNAAIDRSGANIEEAFVAVLAPGWLDHFIFNEYYKTEEEFLFALADALHEEYRAVVAAGFVLQVDDPGLPDWWDMLKPEPTWPSPSPVQPVPCVCAVESDVAYSLPSRSWIRPARRWRCTAMPIWFGRSLGHAT
jgi:hypothetical protein